MNRRDFVMSTGASVAAIGVSGQSASSAADSPSSKSAPLPIKMTVGCQRGPTTPKLLEHFKRHGVTHICGYPVITGNNGRWSDDDLHRTRDLCEKHGLTLDMVALPFLSSSHIDGERRGAIMLGESPERDRDIADIQSMIASCARVGIPAFKYNMSLLGVLRTSSIPGRGGTLYSTWNLKDARPDKPLTRAGHVTAEMAWERITYFLERIVPVCEEYKVRAACHPQDPGVPVEGYQGVSRVLGTVDGLKRFVSIKESAYHGLNFCVGTIGENLEHPGREIHDVIRYFGTRGKIFNIHFRNIKGRRDHFSEVFPDEGDMNMVRVAQTLREVGYEGMLMPDHMPEHHDDPEGNQAFAYGYGYIKAILQTLEELGATA